MIKHMKIPLFVLITICICTAAIFKNAYCIIGAVIFSIIFLYVITYTTIIELKDKNNKSITELRDAFEKIKTDFYNLKVKFGMIKIQ